MRLLSPLIAVFTFSFFSLVPPHTCGADPQQDTRRPSADERAMLKRFVKECQLVTPGQGRFPATATVGQPQPSPNERARAEVPMAAAFRISRYETTQELYSAVMGGNPSRWQGPRNSVERMTIAAARQFCRRLTDRLRTEKLISDQQFVRLPTDVEWEYCCRAGTKTRFHFGDSIGDAGETDRLDAVAWHTGNAAGNDPAVGVLKPNAWGLFDMHGYLWEFVETPDNVNATRATIRGGSWRDRHPLLSSASYLTIPASETGDHIGFRCVIAEKEAGKKATNR
ncbi:MAG: formylglycine-generating enzyme family protein [Planctomycetaceae bacterium]|nr:formylglycine-generating enzyme family protein [Planctomycetaceae bacterium]